jgi:hypothetical protein
MLIRTEHWCRTEWSSRWSQGLRWQFEEYQRYLTVWWAWTDIRNLNNAVMSFGPCKEA